MASNVDIEALGLLDGLEGKARQERADLVTWLLKRGFAIERLRASAASPLMLPAKRVLGDHGDIVSAREIADSTGVDLESLERLQRAAGLPTVEDPDAAVLLRADGEAAAFGNVFVEIGVALEDVVGATRVLLEGLGHATEMMRESALKTMLRPGASEVELSSAAEQLTRKAAPLFGPWVEGLLLLQLRHSFEAAAVNAAERAAGELLGAREVTIGFADIVGFTKLGELLAPEMLGQVAGQLSDLAHDVVQAPVRLVKSIGDAVMFACFQPEPLLKVVLDLADAVAAKGLPRLRIGVATGSAVSIAGDWFGSPVNVASRVTGTARPGTVLVTESTRDALDNTEGFIWSADGVRRLKGVTGELKVFLVERISD